MNKKTIKMIDSIQTGIKEAIEECGNPTLESEPVGYGAVLGLKGALSIIHAVCKIEEATEDKCNKPIKKETFERTCEYQMCNPMTKQILCEWFYKHLSEPYQIYCHFPECNLEKCPLKNKGEII